MKKILSTKGGACLVNAFVLFVLVMLVVAPTAPVFALQADGATQSLPQTTNEIDNSDQSLNTLDQNIDNIDTLSQNEQSNAMSMNSVITPTESLTEIGDVTKNHLSPEIDSTTGALVYKYNIKVPPGRNGMTPDLSLSYNSANAIHDSVFGSGWEINIPYIQRINKHGSNNFYSDDYYVSSLSGELVSLGSGYYSAKNENGDFLKYELNSNVWTVTDKSGVKYKFGTTSDSRQDNPADNTQIYKWMLEESRDKNENFASYEYYKDAGQIYPLYINYTGHSTSTGIFKVSFVHSSRTALPSNFDTGFSVISNYRITEIKTEINNVLARKYSLTYTTGDNGSGSLLDKIAESGRDDSNNIVTLPETNFDYSVSTVNWTYNSSLSIPLPFLDNTTDFGMRTADVNGDGLVDIVCHNENANGHCNKTNPEIYLNNGSGWTDVSSTWLFPVKVDDSTRREAFIGSTGQDLGLRLVDVNGDLKVDLVRGIGSAKYVYLNTGSGWSYSSSLGIPLQGFLDSNRTDYGFRMGDINGDGLPDIICYNESANGHCNKLNPGIYLNNGSGWTDMSSSWLFPVKVDDSTKREAFVGNTYQDLGLRLFDVNGDGLADLVRGRGSSKYVYLNTGSGWVNNTSWNLPLQGFINSSGQDYGFRIVDINGDNLPDILCHNEMANGTCSKYNAEIYINNGAGWIQSGTWGFPTKAYDSTKTEVFLNSSLQDSGLRIIDINGDGLDDLVKAISFSNKYLYIHNEDIQANLLSNIDYPEGGSTEISYKATAIYKDSSGNILNPEMPIISDVVKETSTSDGNGGSIVNQYEYLGGKYYFNDYMDRKSAGFHIIKKIDSDGNVTKTFYHQGDSSDTSNGEYNDHASKIGKIYRTEEYDNSNNLYSVEVNKWDKYNLGTGRDFVKLVQVTDLSYDGGTSHKDIAKEITYDNNYGNVIEEKNFGEVVASNDGSYLDIGSDISDVIKTYAANTTDYILGLPSSVTTYDQSNNKVNQNKIYYDNLSLGSVSYGNETKIEKWVSGSSFVNTQKSYNSYGLVDSVTDENGNVKNNTYDSYYLYPVVVANPLSQPTAYTYDYSSGEVKDTTDPNNRVFTKIYDGLDRILEIYEPDQNSPTTAVLKTRFVYTDSSGSFSVLKTDYLDNSISVDSYNYFDGLNRKIQARTQTEATNNFNVVDYVYNSLGLLERQSLPYVGSGYTKTSPTSSTSLLMLYDYDSLGRVTSVTNSVGVTSNDYNLWVTTVTDAEGNVKNYYYDAYNNLVKVSELLSSGGSYDTYYEWNLNGKLVKITDALGNIRHFTYDGLGNRLSAEDLHDSGDSTYGTWAYSYDNVGNLITSNDPNGQTVDYTYDNINRILIEDFTSNPGNEITYLYDVSANNGVGRLYSVSTPSIVTTYDYSPNGLIISESSTINSSRYDTTYTYDRQGNKITIGYPDGSSVYYTYNYSGLLESVLQKESGMSYSNIVSNIDYAPNNLPESIEYQNGLVTNNTYDQNHLYRLTNKTTANGSNQLQNISYLYDNVGNITRIIDGTTLASAKTVNYSYDNLYRLIQSDATGASGPGNYTENYTYDALGNVLTKTGTSGTYSYDGNTGTNYANPHAVTSIGTDTLVYDNNGNLLSQTGGNTNTWNYKNQLITSINNLSIAVSYDYDSSGNRIIFNDVTGTTIYPNKYYNTNGTVIEKYVYAGDQLVANIENTATISTVHYINTDHLNSTNVVSDISGNLEELLDYFPFGTERISSGTYSTQRQYLGQMYDSTTELNYLNARYYEGSKGRFTSEDPVFWEVGISQAGQQALLDPQSMNSYSYSGNNPIKNSDPDGRWYKEVLTGQQSWSSFSGEVGQATQYMGSGWQTAMDHPVAAGAAVGVGSGLAAYGAAAGFIALSTQYLGGAGTACVALCNQNGQKLVEQGISNLQQLPRVVTATEKMVERGPNKDIVGINNFLQQAQKGTAYLDNKTDNINIFSKIGDSARYTRTTLNPEGNKIISAGINQARNVINGISKGRFTKITK